MTVNSFYRLATNPDTLRFSFVRNPYARAVSCWAHKFADKPLIYGDFFIDAYLAIRREIDTELPAGPDHTLSFADFVVFAAATAKARHDIHLQTQDEILSMPGITLDLIGKMENFDGDFVRVLDHVGASDEIRREATIMINDLATIIGLPITRLNWPTASIAPTSVILIGSATLVQSRLNGFAKSRSFAS